MTPANTGLRTPHGEPVSKIQPPKNGPPTHIQFIYLRLNRDFTLYVRQHHAPLGDRTIVQMEDHLIWLSRPGDGRRKAPEKRLIKWGYNFEALAFPEPSTYLSIFLDEDAWDFSPANEDCPDPLIFIAAKTRWRNDGTPETFRHFLANKRFYNLEARAVGNDKRPLLRCTVDGPIMPDTPGIGEGYAFELFLRAPYAEEGTSFNGVTIVIDPRVPNDGPPRQGG
ncbi:hypothetical protein [Sandaracinobacteroides saxicola]|uniref:Uncharacterized protein n=1 Tax=Sandaracinobacteroides saxicola TaxID=2759707 RepID=A0A7G5IJ65_9SPHN|nr:hypothetical protein [Sandaracinobacteroides saxicola]QMW23407.1 hypothetical protein H3309_02580 [Sandaracinobacteroides saxicola]